MNVEEKFTFKVEGLGNEPSSSLERPWPRGLSKIAKCMMLREFRIVQLSPTRNKNAKLPTYHCRGNLHAVQVVMRYA